MNIKDTKSKCVHVKIDLLHISQKDVIDNAA